MKRKAIQLAKQTIVVSLPSKWVKQQGIKKGDEIDVEERGSELVIGGRGKKEEKKIEIDISNLNNRTTGWYLASLYKMGCDIIKIKYDNLSAVKTIGEIIKNAFIGFVIAEQNEKECTIRTVSQDISN
ncbi:MAG: AbrB/MazE/SpoVT family DNA-binding domain-containing protein, partial [Nanoarchaeota archaeon]|nr:AbrB/MazE/SpoVT family DNA-binding domain-containing protein [Nanoarchaeota archaeon]